MANKVCSVSWCWRKPGRPRFGQAVFPAGDLAIVAPEAKNKHTHFFKAKLSWPDKPKEQQQQRQFPGETNTLLAWSIQPSLEKLWLD